MSKVSTIPINTSISDEKRKDLSLILSKYLSDAYYLYLKTHVAHWNIQGPMFNTLHAMFEEQYTSQWQAIDEVAERIRALGHLAPSTPAQFSSLTSIDANDEPSSYSSWKEVVGHIISATELTCITAKKVIKEAEEASDYATADLITSRLQEHEKTMWMLRSLLA